MSTDTEHWKDAVSFSVSICLLWVSYLWACVNFVKVRQRKFRSKKLKKLNKREQLCRFVMVLKWAENIFWLCFPPNVHFGKWKENELTHHSWCQRIPTSYSYFHSSKEYLLLLFLISAGLRNQKNVPASAQWGLSSRR